MVKIVSIMCRYMSLIGRCSFFQPSHNIKNLLIIFYNIWLSVIRFTKKIIISKKKVLKVKGLNKVRDANFTPL